MNLLINLDNVGVSLYPGLNQDWASLVALTVKCLPTMCETQIQSLGQEDPLEKEMANQYIPVLLPGKSYGWRNLSGYSPG